MTAHIAHVRDEQERPILCDGCPRCEEHAEAFGLSLDTETFRRFWHLMIRVEFDDTDVYRSEAEARLGRQMYQAAVALDRNLGFDYRALDA